MPFSTAAVCRETLHLQFFFKPKIDFTDIVFAKNAITPLFFIEKKNIQSTFKAFVIFLKMTNFDVLFVNPEIVVLFT